MQSEVLQSRMEEGDIENTVSGRLSFNILSTSYKTKSALEGWNLGEFLIENYVRMLVISKTPGIIGE